MLGAEALAPGHIKSMYVTKTVLAQHGPSPGCHACLGISTRHSSGCRDRFEKLYGRRPADVPGPQAQVIIQADDAVRMMEGNGPVTPPEPMATMEVERPVEPAASASATGSASSSSNEPPVPQPSKRDREETVPEETVAKKQASELLPDVQSEAPMDINALTEQRAAADRPCNYLTEAQPQVWDAEIEEEFADEQTLESLDNIELQKGNDTEMKNIHDCDGYDVVKICDFDGELVDGMWVVAGQ